jgi:hypothetical protein
MQQALIPVRLIITFVFVVDPSGKWLVMNSGRGWSRYSCIIGRKWVIALIDAAPSTHLIANLL